jgi:hypothetical protein
MDPTIDFFSAWSLMAILLTRDDMVAVIEARRERCEGWEVVVVVSSGLRSAGCRS